MNLGCLESTWERMMLNHAGERKTRGSTVVRCEMSSEGHVLEDLVPVADTFGRVVEPLGGRATLEEVGH